MKVTDELLAQLHGRLLPQPRSLRFTGGELGWNGEPFALQLQGSWTARAQRQLTGMLQPFNRAEGPERSLRVFCGGEDIEFLPADSDPASAAGKFSANYGVLGSQANERYELSISAQGILLSAPTEIGVLRGTQTLTQLLTHALDLQLQALPCLHIDDEPALAWRGLLIDVARHFIELPVLLRTLEGMAHHKMNVLHLHLSDDQAFRFPSAAYPRLNQFGPSYTINELRELVAHANSLGIRVVPELDMPGHTTSWLAAYPQWSLHKVSESTRFGVHSGCLNPADETTFTVIAELLAEFAAVFPDECVHIGGDEVHPRWWAEHPRVQEFMASQGFAEPRDLQAYFNARVAELLAAQGKRMLVWDEAIHESLPKNVVVQAWRGMTARDAALAQGYECIVSAPYYLDLFYPSDLHTRFAPSLPLAPALEAEDAMLEDVRLAHVAGGLEWTKQWRDRPHDSASPANESTAQPLLGAEACLWSELVDGELLDVRLWSRLPLLAELFWRGAQPEDERYTRIEHSLRSWETCGGPALTAALAGSLSHDQLELLKPSGVAAAAAELLAVLEPSKWYSRLLGADALAARLQGSEMPQARPYGTTTELRAIADVISPQSFRTAEFAQLLARWQLGPLVAADVTQLANWISSWQGQGTVVRSLSLAPELAAQLSELAQRLEAFAQLLERLVADAKDGAFKGDMVLARDTEQLKAWLAPIGELMLAPPGALLALSAEA